jgi:hypothetical protein
VASEAAGVGIGRDGASGGAEVGFGGDGVVRVGGVAMEDEGSEGGRLEGDVVKASVRGVEADEGLASGGKDGSVVFEGVEELDSDGDFGRGWSGEAVLVQFLGEAAVVAHLRIS